MFLSSNIKGGYHQTSSNAFSENGSRGWFHPELRVHVTHTRGMLTRPEYFTGRKQRISSLKDAAAV